jgi:hypothetical protein
MEEFEKFWQAYPRKLAKGDARKAWQQTAKIRPPIEKLLKAVFAARASEQWHKDGGMFIPYPATWLRGERWEDEYDVHLGQMSSPVGRVCGYCGKASIGSVNGIYHCAEHVGNAMSCEKTKVVSLGGEPVIDLKVRSAGG